MLTRHLAYLIWSNYGFHFRIRIRVTRKKKAHTKCTRAKSSYKLVYNKNNLLESAEKINQPNTSKMLTSPLTFNNSQTTYSNKPLNNQSANQRVNL